jgi:hypothetical protein
MMLQGDDSISGDQAVMDLKITMLRLAWMPRLIRNDEGRLKVVNASVAMPKGHVDSEIVLCVLHKLISCYERTVGLAPAQT